MAPPASPQKQKIWIDTDIIFNKPGEKVDDTLALMMAFNNKINILFYGSGYKI